VQLKPLLISGFSLCLNVPKGFFLNITVKWVTSASWIAQNQRTGDWATRPLPKRLNNHQISAATQGSTSSEWLKLRCSIMFATGSAAVKPSHRASRSGRVPSAAPASRAARRCPGGAMAAATAPPSTIWVRESMGRC